MEWLTNLCNCFSPEMRRNIIGYMSASNLNRQVIQEQKCTEQIQQDKDEQSIYQHVKQRSYYTIHGDDLEQIEKQHPERESNQLQFENNQLDPVWYPQTTINYDEIYLHKLKALKHIFQTEIHQQYQKVYDSQDQNNLIIHAKNQLEKGKRINVYRFSFSVPNSDQPSQPKDYLQLQTINSQGKSFLESLLNHKQLIEKTSQNLEIYYRTYQKKLVISQHDFVTAQKTHLEEQLDEELSSEGKQLYNDIVYTVTFSVKGIKDEKSVLYNRGHINLCGMKVYLQNKQQKNESNEEELIPYKQLTIEGYINVDLDTTVNSNMLKQPVAKQIRTYAQKLICMLQKSDAI